MAGVLKYMNNSPKYALGFDISWSRSAEAQGWLSENEVSAKHFVADLFDIPLGSASIHVVCSSYSHESNVGLED